MAMAACRLGFFFVLAISLPFSVSSLPNSELARLTITKTLSGTQQQQQHQPLMRFFRRAAKNPVAGISASTTSPTQLSLFSGLEPISESLKTVWEFYQARDDILSTFTQRGLETVRHNVIRTLAFSAAAIFSFDALARLGCIGDRGKGLLAYGRSNRRRWSRSVRRAITEDYPSWIAKAFTGALKGMGRLPERAKFGVAFTAGAMLSKSMLRLGIFAFKTAYTTLVFLEVLSFLGILGEPGESLFDDETVDLLHYKETKWYGRAFRFRRDVKTKIRPHTMMEIYEDIVTEEKIAAMGLACGSLVGMLL